jgi:hypothetical protein
VREAVAFVLWALIEAEVAEHIGAGASSTVRPAQPSATATGNDSCPPRREM